ncbi:MAG: CDP-glycerol glycerophosphotransferase family protein [Propionicimonas sp.]
MTSLKRRLAALGRAPAPEWEELVRALGPAPWLPDGLARQLEQTGLVLLVAGHVALLAGLLTGVPAVVAVGWLLAAGLDWLVTRVDSPGTRLVEFAGARAPIRAALRSVLALSGLAAAGAPLIGFALTVLLVHVVWIALGALATWLWRSAPPLRFLPGAAGQPQPLTRYAAALSGGLGTPGALVAAEGAAVSALVLAGSGAPWLPWGLILLGSTVALGRGAVAVAEARRLLSRQADDEAALLAELSAGDPTYLVYVSLGAAQSRYIVNQWAPVFEATPLNGLMVVREASQLRPLVPTRVPVVYAPSTRHVERLTLPSITVAFYLAYGEKNAHLLRDPTRRHVMLLHGDSDKATSANAQARAFDEVWVAGPAAIERYRSAGVDVPRDRFVIIGRPQVEHLPVGPTGAARPTVLYAPTFEGYYDHTSHTSLDVMGPALVRQVLAEFPQASLWFKPHPASGVVRPSMLGAIAEVESLLETGHHVIVARHPELSLNDCLATADVLITDISSVATDFLATTRPVIVTNPQGLPLDDFHAAYPSQRGCYVIGPELATLTAAMTDALGPDPLRPERLAMRAHVLGDLPAGPQAAFDEALARLSGRAVG